jgi:ubiquinol-cytochrome c reductase cytochrome b/c1 subunit
MAMLFEEDPENPAGRIPTKGPGAVQVPRDQGPLWSFGMLAGVSLVLMLLTGVFLAMNYVVGVQPFETIQWIMRDVSYGWLIRLMHMAGASIFFVIAFINLGRSLYYGSYKRPRQRVWMLGLVTLILMMLTAYTGYLLPMGQMSYWSTLALAQTVAGFPFVGHNIVRWIMGADSIDSATLTHFYTFHLLFAVSIIGAVMAHLQARRIDRTEAPPAGKERVETVPFHPFYTVRAAIAVLTFLIVGAVIVFFLPYTFEQSANFQPADPLVMPSNIPPHWSLLPFYAMTRCTQSPLLSLALVVAGWAVLFALPWLDPSLPQGRELRRRPLFQPALFGFFVVVVLLGWAGAHPTTSGWVLLDRLFTLLYFLFFLVGVPLLGVIETPGVSLNLGQRFSVKALLERRGAGAVVLAALLGTATAAQAQDTANVTRDEGWGFKGAFGTFNKASLQRGFEVYAQACAACHGMQFLRYGDLEGIGLSPAQTAAIAATAQVPGGTDSAGLPVTRPGIPSDPFHNPWPNAQAARAASYGAYPPDLSLIVDQRPDGPTYIDHLLTGYGDAPPGVTLFPNRSWNAAFPGNQIAMAAPLRAGQMTFLDGTRATVPQMSRDVTTFLAWASDPSVEERRQDGVRVILFLIFLLFLTTLLRRRIWGVLPRA